MRLWIIFAVLCSLLCLAVAQNSSNFLSAEDRARVHELAVMDSIGGLQGWANMGHGIRSSALHGWPTAIVVDGTVQVKAITTWLAGAIAMLAICFLFSFVTLLFCCCFYCCRSCGNCGGSKPKSEGYTPFERNCALATLVLGITLVLVGFILGLVSNSVVNTGIDNLVFSVEAAAADLSAIPSRFSNTFGNAINEIENTVNAVFNLILQVPGQYLGSNGELSVLVRNTTSTLIAVQGNFDVLIARAYVISNATANLLTSFNTLKTQIDGVQESFQYLGTYHQDPNNGSVYYSFSVGCLFNASFNVVNISGAIPSFTDQISTIAGVNLNSTAATVNNTFNTISINITDLVDNQLNGFRGDVNNGVNQTRSVLNDDVQPYLDSVSTYTDQYQGVLDDYIDLYVATVNKYRYSVMAALFSFSLLPIIICLVFFFFKKSPGMTCAAVFCFCLVSLFWILCSLHLIVAAPLGKICDTYYDESIAQLLELLPIPGLNSNSSGPSRRDILNLGNSTLLQPHDLNYYVSLYYGGIDACMAGGNLIDYLNLTNVVNLEGYVDQFIDSANFTELVNGINVENLLGNIDFTSNLNLTDVSAQLAGLNTDFSVYVGFIDNIALFPIIGDINNVTRIINLQTPVLIALSPCLNTTDRLDAANGVSNELNAIKNTLLQINETTIQYIIGNLSLISNELNGFAQAANATINLADNLLDGIDNITNSLVSIANSFKNQILTQTIPQGLSDVRSLTQNVQGLIVNFTQCQSYAEDLNSIINSFCISLIGGIDAVWVTCGFLGLMEIIMIVGITLVAKRWIRADTMDQEYGEDYYTNDGIELPPVYSETDKKA